MLCFCSFCSRRAWSPTGWVISSKVAFFLKPSLFVDYMTVDLENSCDQPCQIDSLMLFVASYCVYLFIIETPWVLASLVPLSASSLNWPLWPRHHSISDEMCFFSFDVVSRFAISEQEHICSEWQLAQYIWLDFLSILGLEAGELLYYLYSGNCHTSNHNESSTRIFLYSILLLMTQNNYPWLRCWLPTVGHFLRVWLFNFVLEACLFVYDSRGSVDRIVQ